MHAQWTDMSKLRHCAVFHVWITSFSNCKQANGLVKLYTVHTRNLAHDGNDFIDI